MQFMFKLRFDKKPMQNTKKILIFTLITYLFASYYYYYYYYVFLEDLIKTKKFLKLEIFLL